MSKRIFFPRDVKSTNDVPFLQAAALRLIDLAAQRSPSALSMEQFVCILPGRRAIRTMEAYLVSAIQKKISAGEISAEWTPPVFLQLGEAPEKLYDRNKPEANSLVRLYAMRRALETFLTDPQRQSAALALFPTPPNDDEISPAASLKRLLANQTGAVKLAQTLLKLDQQLANDRKSWRDVANACGAMGLDEERRRWLAVGELKSLYRDELRNVGYIDRNDARELALRDAAIGASTFDADATRRYFVVGAVDLNRQQKDVFAALGDRVEYWIFAPSPNVPEEEKTPFDKYFEENVDAFFDESGCVVPERWNPGLAEDGVDFMLPVRDENIFQVDEPREQGEAVAALVRELSLADDGSYKRIKPEQLTIGAPDQEVVPYVESAMKELDYQTIHGEGTPATHNRVFRTLELFAKYLETRSFDVLGELLRRPDVERWLCRVWALYPNADEDVAPEESQRLREMEEAENAADDERAAEEAESGGENDARVNDFSTSQRRWLAEFDEYRAKFVPTRVDGRWFVYRDEDNTKYNRYYLYLRKAARIIDKTLERFFEEMKFVVARNARSGVDALQDATQQMRVNLDELVMIDNVQISTSQRRRPLREWSKIVSKLVDEIYRADLISDVEERSQISGFVTYLNRSLTNLAQVPDFGESDQVTGSFAIQTILSEIRGKSVPPMPGSHVVEIQGWLDLLFDDAPYCILTGFNEHVIPSTRSSDLFLPNEMCRTLGLSDATSAFARDAYLAYTLAATRDAFFIVFEKRTSNDDPRTPSRLLFAAPEETIPQRIVRYFGLEGRKPFEALKARHSGRKFPLATKKDAATPLGATFEIPTLILRESNPAVMTRVHRVDAEELERSRFVMNVTDFETFLNSPYRFLLKKYFRLNPAPTGANELNAADFGSLAHAVLRDFGKLSLDADKLHCERYAAGERVESADDSKEKLTLENATRRFAANRNLFGNEYEIFRWLSLKLDEHASRAFNEYSSPFARVQLEEIRARLRSFAAWQAKWYLSGHRIKYVEKDARVSIAEIAPNRTPGEDPQLDKLVDATEVYGRIDRIDYCVKENRWYVFDYKTFDNSKEGSQKNSDDFVSIRDETTSTDLLKSQLGNKVDIKHRTKLSGTENWPKALVDEAGTAEKPQNYRWINLQLPLYRHFLKKIEGRPDMQLARQASPDASFVLGYIVLSASETVVQGAPWRESDLASADATCRWVVESIYRIFASGRVAPDQRIDGVLRVLDDPSYDDYAPITQSDL